MSIEQTLADREMGQVPVSIGTSLAMEGLFGVYPDRPVTPMPLLSYNRLWINLSTLFRNLYHVLPTEARETVTAEHLVPALLSEIEALNGAIQNAVGSQVKVTYYLPDYSQLAKTFPEANLRHASTLKQKIYAGLQTVTLQEIGAYLDELDVRITPIKLPGEGRAVMLTHQAVDLLSYYQFDDLTLIESHTGELKKKAVWFTKLGTREPILPFNAFTLQLFGDGSGGLFSPFPIKYRRALLGVAKSDRWSPATTLSRIRLAISTIKDPSIRDRLLELYQRSSF